jgi:7-carboxy-7-deazaguanine synthase
MTVDQIVEKIRSYKCNVVEITGGEPLLQKDVHSLFRSLLEENFTVLLETSGERDLSLVDHRIIKIMDLKCPSSGEAAHNRLSNLEHLSARDEVKFVVGNRSDFEWAGAILNQYQLARRVNAVLMSPVFGLLPPAELAGWILSEKLPVRMQLQMHKQIWPDEARGV